MTVSANRSITTRFGEQKRCQEALLPVWDAHPWTPKLRAEREALSLINFLRVQSQPQSEWLAAPSADPPTRPAIRPRMQALR